ncbi:MAG: family 78 glycoside hydrolase catalytic domain, partial [Spirochaetota bacterium]
MEWKAKWIWDYGHDRPKNYWLCFRRKFSPPDFETASLRITADSRYFAYINGTFLGSGPVRCWPFEQSYDTYQVEAQIKKDCNILAVLVTHYGTSTSQYVEGRGGFFAQLDFLRNGKSIYSLYTDSGWKNCIHRGYSEKSVRINIAQPWVEIFDAGSFPSSWKDLEYDDSSWSDSKELGEYDVSPWENMRARDIPWFSREEKKFKKILSCHIVKPSGQHVCIDVKTLFYPGNYDSIDKTHLGYLAALVIAPQKMRGQIRLLSRQNPEKTERMCINQAPYYFRNGEDAQEVVLSEGSNTILIDISGCYQTAVMSYHFLFPESLKFEAPVYGRRYQFISIGPFQSGDILNIMAIDKPLNYSDPVYQSVWEQAIKGELLNVLKKDLCGLKPWLKPVPDDLVVSDNPHFLSMYRHKLRELPLPVDRASNPRFGVGSFLLLPFDSTDIEVIIDFEEEISAFLEFELEAYRGIIIDIEFVESIHGSIVEYPLNMHSAMRYITCDGRQSYQSTSRRGFRYCIFTFREVRSPIRILSIKAVQRLYPVEEKGSFHCSDTELNKIWEISRRSVKLCMEDTYVDCPAYEQACWIGDGQVEALFNYYLFGAYDLSRRVNRLTVQSLRRSLLPEAQVPTGCTTILTAWVLLWIQSVRDYFEFTGDIEEVQNLMPFLIRISNTLCTFLNDDNLLSINSWNMLDWAPMDTP